MIRDTHDQFGALTKLLHWLTAVAVIGLFGSGFYMVGLDYYDPLYHLIPNYHKSFGILFGVAISSQIVWRLINKRPKPVPTLKRWEHLTATTVQVAMYVLMALIAFLGYLISTSAGAPISVFGWFDVPATIIGIENQADLAGFWHKWGAYTLIFLAAVHAMAALKHHFIDKDNTLRRMLLSRRD
ncbi:cytochrome b [Ostreibacterium oceani]|uniref:Cytochrome b n=1 Tax=Ostreibacterium oceani TaxID=2654998 RepID=A0A6N7EZC2_9GAMM|nr:cytochrome b [Ostreibacterium oceani]MPV86875.1 cytochrome b [Ostreibacterium oceani]